VKFDIVTRLRNPPFGTETSERNIMDAAADEIERLRAALEPFANAADQFVGDLSDRAADALTAQAARIAELERELEARKNYTDEDYIRLHNAHCMTADKLAAAEARAERLEAALRETWRVLDAAGTLNLTRGVQLGPTSWYVKIEDARLESRAALSPAPSKGGDDGK
jgi:hypothetical protein